MTRVQSKITKHRTFLKSRFGSRPGLRSRLILAFLITSIIPVIAVNLFAYMNTASIVRDNMQEMTEVNLSQTRNSLDVWLESYEDILFQVYTDDDIVALVDKINGGEDVAVSRNQLRRTLHGLFYTKEYIKCISILTENGSLIFYDLLTGSSTRNSWIDNYSLSRSEIYDQISADSRTHVLSTCETEEIASEQSWLFHLGHRIIDYRNVDRRLGVVVVSVDAELLSSICGNEDDEKNNYNFIVDNSGNLVSWPDKEKLSSKIISWSDDKEERQAEYLSFILENESTGAGQVSVDLVHDEKFNWDIVNVSDGEEVMERLNAQQRILMITLAVSLGALSVMIMILSRNLTGSLKNVVSAMKRAGKGELSVRVLPDKKMTSEVATIALEFNRMLERLSEAMDKEREAGERQRQAEIAALEAQMNPHFLYNTLDTINWMAIEKEDYEISNSISALAHILRYGIDNSNGIVTVHQEAEWLKKYLFLQQTRLKNTFQCEMHIAPEIMEYRIHKLLLQPFVENAILHGFEGVKRTYFLSVTICRDEEENNSGENGEAGVQTPHEKESLLITIYDNGKGIPPELVEQMNQGIFPKSGEKNHIGMENAINRIHMYYGQNGSVKIESIQGEYTRISVRVLAELATERKVRE